MYMYMHLAQVALFDPSPLTGGISPSSVTQPNAHEAHSPPAQGIAHLFNQGTICIHM